MDVGVVSRSMKSYWGKMFLDKEVEEEKECSVQFNKGLVLSAESSSRKLQKIARRVNI